MNRKRDNSRDRTKTNHKKSKSHDDDWDGDADILRLQGLCRCPECSFINPLHHDNCSECYAELNPR